MSLNSSLPAAENSRPSLLSLPLDIHTLLLNYLSPDDIQKLRALSRSSYEVFTSPVICSIYLSLHGILSTSQETARTEFDNYFIPRARKRKGKPTRAIVVDGLRLNHIDAPYFTTSHAYQSVYGNTNRDGVVAYRTLAGDLALLDLSNPSNSSVLLITEEWEFTTQSLVEYNKSGAGVAVDGGIKERVSSGWWTAESLKDKRVGLKKFDIKIHNDFGGQVMFVELTWTKDEETETPYDVLSLLTAAHTPLPAASEAIWYPVIAQTKNLGLVISLDSNTFGHPIAALSLPQNKFPFAEYVLNAYYVAGIVPTTLQFAYLRYARTGMETVCSLQGVTKENHGSQLFWSIPEYLPAMVLINLSKMGLTEFQTAQHLAFVNNLDIHVQPDRIGELVFVVTGAGVTAFDITRASQYGGLNAVKSFWWREKKDIQIFMPTDEELDRDEIKKVGPWRGGMWAHSPYREGCGIMKIAPSVPRIWKSFLPGKSYGGGEDNDEMFTIVRAYNYFRPYEDSSLPADLRSKEVIEWQRPEFLVAWEIPLTRAGVEKYSPRMLNGKAGFESFTEGAPDRDSGKRSHPHENTDGIYPRKIMQLQPALKTNLAGNISCYEAHLVLLTGMPQTLFTRRDTHKTKPRWLTISGSDMKIEEDEYRAIVGPLERGRWKVEGHGDRTLRVQRKEGRALLSINLNTRLPCERPCPRAIRHGKRRSFVSMFWGKGDPLHVPTDERATMPAELDALPHENIHHVKVGDSGNYIAYVTRAPLSLNHSVNRFRGGGPGGALVIVRYD